MKKYLVRTPTADKQLITIPESGADLVPPVSGGNPVLGPYTFQTTNNTPTSVATVAVAAGEVVIVEATALVKEVSGGAQFHGSQRIVQTVEDVLGTVYICGTAVSPMPAGEREWWQNNGETWTLTWANGTPEAGLIRLYASGVAARTFSWVVYISVLGRRT